MADDLATWLKNHPPTGRFVPSAWYNAYGDELEVWWEDEQSYAEEVSNGQWNVMALQRAMSDKRIVGVTIYSISARMREAGNLRTKTDREARCYAWGFAIGLLAGLFIVPWLYRVLMW